MVIVDPINKTAYAVQQALTYRALADVVPDRHAKRIVARGVFVAVVTFIDVIRRVPKAIRRKTNGPALEALRFRVNRQLAERDWGPYAELRDRIAAHRQPIGANDHVEGWASANELWAQVDAPLIGVLCSDLVEIYDDLRAIAGGPSVAVPSVPGTVAEAIGGDEHFAPVVGAVRVDVGSFGETRAGSLSVIQGGTVGERLRHLADTLDAFETHAVLLGHVLGEPGLERAVRAALVIEACNFVELALDVPERRRPQDHYEPLVDLLPAHYAERADLMAARAALHPTEVDWLRGLRNRIAAHIDARGLLVHLVGQLDRFDPARLQAIWDVVDYGLTAASHHPASVVRPLAMRGAQLNGLERADSVQYPAPY